jgi:hypothetical protein
MNPSKAHGARLTIRRIWLWTLYVAIFAAVFSVLPATKLSFGAASMTAFLFIAVDVLFPSRWRCPGLLALSFFACGLAYAVATGFFVLEQYPPPATPKPQLPFWAGLYHLVSGQFLRDIGDAIAAALAILIYYTMAVVACTVVSTLVALFTLGRHWQSKWILLLNAPGILLTVWFCVVMVCEILNDG